MPHHCILRHAELQRGRWLVPTWSCSCVLCCAELQHHPALPGGESADVHQHHPRAVGPVAQPHGLEGLHALLRSPGLRQRGRLHFLVVPPGPERRRDLRPGALLPSMLRRPAQAARACGDAEPWQPPAPRPCSRGVCCAPCLPACAPAYSCGLFQSGPTGRPAAGAGRAHVPWTLCVCRL